MLLLQDLSRPVLLEGGNASGPPEYAEYDAPPAAPPGGAPPPLPPAKAVACAGALVRLHGALWGFLWFYVVCLAITWFFYSRKGAPVSC